MLRDGLLAVSRAGTSVEMAAASLPFIADDSVKPLLKNFVHRSSLAGSAFLFGRGGGRC